MQLPDTDFVVVAGGVEFPVCSSVLASASGYFRALLDIGMKEQTSRRVEFQTSSAQVLESLLTFIQEGEYVRCPDVDTVELLELAVYLDVPNAIDAYSTEIVESELNVENWWIVLSLFRLHNLTAAVSLTRKFVVDNFRAIALFPEHVLSADLEGVELLANVWAMGERELFDLLTAWLKHAANRQCHADRLLTKVRYGLLTPAELSDAKTSSLDGEEWRSLVGLAEEYHTLEVPARVVFYDSDQNKMRGSPEALVLYETNMANKGDAPEKIHVFNGAGDWQTHEFHMDEESARAAFEVASIPPKLLFSMNGFLLLQSVHFTAEVVEQHWAIFDLRTKKWCEIALPPEDSCGSTVLIFHDKSLYLFNGDFMICSNYFVQGALAESKIEWMEKNAIHKYSFASDTWQSVAKHNLSVGMTICSACCLDGQVYVGGKRIADQHTGAMRYEMDRYNLATGEWEQLGEAPEHASSLQVFGERGVCYMNKNLELMIYDVDQRTWTKTVMPFRDRTARFSRLDLRVTGTAVYVCFPESGCWCIYRCDATKGTFVKSVKETFRLHVLDLAVMSVPYVN